jgi:hypothetical protein
MTATGQDDGFTASYVHDDKQRRGDFDRRLGSYLGGQRERWDITAIVEPLELLGRKARQVDVHLRRGAAGKLSVTLGFELAPTSGGRSGEAAAQRNRPPPPDGPSTMPNG